MSPPKRMTAQRWQGLMEALGLPLSESTGEELIRVHSQRNRHYHNTHHVDACLRHLDEHAECADSAAEIELALWFHDAVYRPLLRHNERKSAEWATRFLRESENGRRPWANRVPRLIMATRHIREPKTRDQAVIADIDLAILASDEATYAAFEKAVRREYRVVPYFLYRRKREKILRSFLDRPVIYHNETLRSLWESRARKNLATALGEM